MQVAIFTGALEAKSSSQSALFWVVTEVRQCCIYAETKFDDRFYLSDPGVPECLVR